MQVKEYAEKDNCTTKSADNINHQLYKITGQVTNH